MVEANLSGAPKGNFWIVSLGVANHQHFIRNVAVEIKPGANSITFDPRNTMMIY